MASFVFLVEMGFHHVSQAGLKLLTAGDQLALAPLCEPPRTYIIPKNKLLYQGCVRINLWIFSDRWKNILKEVPAMSELKDNYCVHFFQKLNVPLNKVL